MSDIALTCEERTEKEVNPNGRIVQKRILEVKLPSEKHGVHARFVQQGFVERTKKIFVDEVEVGNAPFDDSIYVVTDTRAPTARLLGQARVQEALIRLVGPTSYVEIEPGLVRAVDEQPVEDGKVAKAELLAVAAHLARL
jgi:hypothetical protein